MRDMILDVKNLKKYFKTPSGMLHAVDDVSFSIERGRTLGIVGESGCGKSTTGRAILRLIEPTSGEVLFEGKNIPALKEKEMHEMRREMQIIFQDPFASLNPRHTVYQAISEPIRFSKLLKTREEIEERTLELMRTVGLAERYINAYPHELDGGRRQRIGLARALSLNPKFIVCDEPVSALDVSIQAQLLNLLKDLQEQMGLTYIFITHDLDVVNHFADDIAVMYLGKVIEKAPAEELFRNPMHPYTKALLSAIPVPDVNVRMQLLPMTGEISSQIEPGAECRFAKRCPYTECICKEQTPELREVSPGNFLACARSTELNLPFTGKNVFGWRIT